MKNLIAIPVLLAAVALVNAAPPTRLHSAIRSGDTFVLGGHRAALLSSAQDLGEVDSALPLANLELHFKLSPAQSADLNSLLLGQRDPGSESYRKWLTPGQYGARFGVNDRDLKKVRAWLEEAGFSDVQLSRSRNFLRLAGTSGDAKNLFGAAIHDYRRHGQQFHAPSTGPLLPRALQGFVSGIKGLSNYRLHPLNSRAPHPQFSVGMPGNHFLVPNDIATIYNLVTLYNQGIDGTGQTIAVVGQSDIDVSDIEAFQAAAGLPIKDPIIVTTGPDPGSDPGAASEADLDLEWAGGVAPGASIVYVNSSDVYTSIEYAIDQNLAPVISISWGGCEAAFSPSDVEILNASFQQANAQGITIVVASGDEGAADCDESWSANGPQFQATNGLAVDFPSSSPYVTAVGGTEFHEAQGSFWNSSGQATSYIPEIAWNDTLVNKYLSASGGGTSRLFPKPAWQQGAGVPNDGFRDVPDVALSAAGGHDGYLTCSGGSCANGFAPPLYNMAVMGGTSCGAPVFAGIVALLNQKSQQSQGSGNSGGQGNINPGLYALASFQSGVFHDVVLGDNRVPCKAGTPDCSNESFGFSAGPGYDQVTGLGSVDAAQLVEQWGSDFQLTMTPASLTVPAGTTGSASIAVARFANFTGQVGFTCSVAGSLTNTTCFVPAAPVTAGDVTLTVSNSAGSGAMLLVLPKTIPPGPILLLALAVAAVLLWAGRQKLVVSAGLAVLCLITLTNCGSGNTQGTSVVSTPTLSGNITVTATSGVLQHVITIPVTIPPAG